MKGVELKLHINQDTKPTQAACRPIPIHLREKVEKEIDRMIADDIIEPASGPTSWISELVIIEKEDQPGEIRLVTDAREANNVTIWYQTNLRHHT